MLFRLILVFIFTSFGLFAQNVHHHTISSTGVNLFGEKNVIQSIGVPIYGLPKSNNSKIITEGFVHPLAFEGYVKFNSLDISVSPNPFVNYLQISLPDLFQEIKVSLVDLSGKLIYNNSFTNTNELNLDFSNIYVVSQMYVLTIQADHQLYEAKLIRL